MERMILVNQNQYQESPPAPGMAFPGDSIRAAGIQWAYWFPKGTETCVVLYL